MSVGDELDWVTWGHMGAEASCFRRQGRRVTQTAQELQGCSALRRAGRAGRGAAARRARRARPGSRRARRPRARARRGRRLRARGGGGRRRGPPWVIRWVQGGVLRCALVCAAASCPLRFFLSLPLARFSLFSDGKYDNVVWY